MGRWTLDDIAWDRFDPQKVDPEILRIVKAASVVEYNGGDYALYLCNVFGDDPGFQEAARQWASEEVQHGEALGRWASLADPDFDFDAAFARFRGNYRLPLESTASVRGSRTGELVARCMVEVGTSSYYSALAEASDEPVLKEVCRMIAADELRHYKLFYSHLKRYLDREQIGRARRVLVAFLRAAETEDDELAYAYWAANSADGEPYDRKSANLAYSSRVARYYQPKHVERAIAMSFKAAGLSPQSRLVQWLSRLGYGFLQIRKRRLAAA